MKRTILSLMIAASLLAGCNLPSSRTNPTPSNFDLETQVAQLLTNVPATQSAPAALPPGSVTALPTQPPMQLALPTAATPTPLPTVTSEPSLSPTTAPIQTATPAPTATATQAPVVVTTTAPTAAASGTKQATIIPSAGDPRSKLGNPTWQDNFADDTNWSTGPNKFTNLTVGNNKLAITGLTDLDGWRLTSPKIADFYLEATLQTGTCSGSDRYGLIARVPDINTSNSGYLVGLTCDGKYSLRRWDGVHMHELIPWTASGIIQAGSSQTNRLGLLASGSNFTVYINGTAMKSATDSTIASGVFGYFVGGNTTPNLTITSTQIAYWENPNL